MKKNWLSKTIMIPAFVLAAIPGMAQKVNEFSVKQCVEYGAQNAVQVKNALLDVETQRQTNKEITAAAYPQVSGSVSLNDYLNIPTSLLPGEIVGQPAGTFAPVKFGTKFNSSGSLDLNQLLFDGQVFVGLLARDVAMQYARKNVTLTQEQIKANVYKIYYQLVVGKKQLESVDANIVRLEKLLHDVTELFKNGFAERLDIDKTNVQLNNLKTEKLKIENSLANGNDGLKFLIGMPLKETLVLSDTLSYADIKAGVLDDGVVNYNDNAQVQVLNLAKRLNEYNVRRYKLTYLPTVAAFANYTKNAQRKTFDFFGRGDWFTISLIGLKVSMPIFDGFARRARVDKAKLDVQRVTNTLDMVKQMIDKDVETSRRNMTNALITLDNQKKNIELSEKVYKTSKLKYEQGLGSNAEIYNANADLKVAQNNYYSALYDAINAKIDFLKAIGKL